MEPAMAAVYPKLCNACRLPGLLYALGNTEGWNCSTSQKGKG